MVFAGLLLLTIAGYVALVLFVRAPGETFVSDGQTMYYTDQGEGEPVVLVHGFAADGHLNWRMSGIVDALKRDFRVITLDARAHGRSAKPHESGQYGMQMVEDIANLMDHLDLDRAHIGGYSMGGFLSLSFAGRYPERVLSLVQGGSGWYPPDEYPDLIQTVPASLDSGGGLEPIVRFMEPEDSWFREFRIAFANTFLCWMNDEQAMARCFEEMATLEGTEEQLRNNRIPAISITGTEDPLREAAENVGERGGNFTVHWIEGADHLSTLSHPRYAREFARVMRDFLREHAASSQLAEGQSSTLPASASS